MQKKTVKARLKALEHTRSDTLELVKAKETPGSMIAMSECKICGKPAFYTMQSLFTCVPCKYVRY